MPAIRVTSKPPESIKCGNCPRLLVVPEFVRAVIFDDLHELDDALREGLVNYSRCSHCGYSAWLWPGFIAFNRRLDRGVFVSVAVEPQANMAALRTETAALVAAVDPGLAAQMEQRLVLLDNYQHVLHVLSCDNELFDMELRASRTFEQRSTIADRNARARQVILDMARSPMLVLRGKERDPAFRRAIIEAAHHLLETQALEPRLAAALQQHLPTLTGQLLDGLPGVEEEASSSEPTPEELALMEDLEKSGARSADGQLSQELREFLRDRATLDIHLSNSAIELPAGLTATLSMLASNTFVSNVIPTTDRSTAGDWRLPPLQAAVDRLAAALPDMRWRIGTGDLQDTLSFARLAAMGNRDAQIGLGTYALGAVQARGEVEPALAVAEFLACVAVTHGDREARIVAASICAQVCQDVYKHPLLEAASWAHGLRAVYSQGTTAINTGVLVVMGVAWQRLGRWAHAEGLHYLAGQCAGESAEMFEHAGRKDGVLTSSIDALACMIDLTPDRVDAAGIDRLIEEADAEADRSAADSLSDGRAEEQRFRVRILKATHASRVAPPPNVVKILGTPRADAGEDVSLPPIVTLEGEAEQVDAPGTIMLAAVSEGDERGRIVCAMFSRVGWASVLMEVIGLARAARNWTVWSNAYAHLLEMSDGLRAPELMAYLCGVIRSEGAALEIPQKHLRFAALVISEARARAGELLAQQQSPQRDEEFQALMPNVERLVQLATAELRDEDEVMSHSRPTMMLMQSAELLECAGWYRQAALAFERMGEFARSEMRADRGPSGVAGENFATYVCAVYRSVRASLKYWSVEGAAFRLEDIHESFELVELSKIPGLRLRTDEKKNAHARRALVDDLPIRFADLERVCAPNDAILMLSLLHETDINTGRWLWAMIFPGHDAKSLVMPLGFDEVHSAFCAVRDAMERARNVIVGRPLAASLADLAQTEPEVNEALERLADVLFPHPLSETLAHFGIDRLYIVPEAYLFDVPWPALRIKTDAGRRYLHQLGPAGVLSIDVLPAWTLLEQAKRDWRSRPGNDVDVKSLFVDRPRWRRDLAPIYAAREKYIAALGPYASVEDVQGSIAADCTVSETTGALRDARLCVFFGHGETAEDGGGTRLIVDDGVIDERLISAVSQAIGLRCQAAFLMACSGISSSGEWSPARTFGGVHIAMVRAGVRFIVGSPVPMFPAVALRALELMLEKSQAESDFDVRLSRVQATLCADPSFAHPVFWGYLLGFGDGAFTIEPSTAAAKEKTNDRQAE